MKQTALDLKLNLKQTSSQTSKLEFLEQREKVVPWTKLVELIAPYCPVGRKDRLALLLESMLRVHFMPQWFTLSNPDTEEAFFYSMLYREFAQVGVFARLPDEGTTLRLRHWLEKHKLAEQILAAVTELLTQRGLLLLVAIAVDATLIGAPSSTKNKDKARDAEMHSSQKGNQWYFGMKAHIWADAKVGVIWRVAMLQGKRKALNSDNEADAMIDKAEKLKAGIRAKMEHPFRVVKRQFVFIKVRYRGLKKPRHSS